MQFNSLTFVAFAAVFFAGWAVIHRRVAMTTCCGYLLAASFVFYGWANPRQVIVLVAIAVASYGCGRWLARAPKKSVLAFAIVCAIGPLVAFKYLDFFLAQIDALLGVAGRELPVHSVGLHVPLGLSFYALSATSYAIDVYTGEVECSTNVIQHATFIAMFPALVSGPILRAGPILPQLREKRLVDEQARWDALKRITYGLAKKCLVADAIGGFVFQFYDDMPVAHSTGLWWLVAILFAIEIYCDFSGYTDIAIGIAGWMGIELPENFNKPYFATSLREYWNRWNISFTSWLRDYIYFPLAKQWPSTFGAVMAVMVTFLVSGLWHGAALTFVVWGLCHGTALCLESWTKWDRRLLAIPGGRVLASVVVFVTVALLMVLVRANDLAQAGHIFAMMFTPHTTEYSWIGRDNQTSQDPTWWLPVVAFVLVELRNVVGFDRSNIAAALRRTNLGWVGIVILLLACVFARGETRAFLYAAF